ncbi:hypothetical protein [Burkholderia ambifaria]|uniref:hypothetical protein n=1 Tax=Burkholderia ambifaria TaxID=152480 RepID=UPI00158AA784|nr:hypothetical protein [Burkholderia ambifaria]
MKPKYGLSQMRNVWIDAYMNGDVDQLNFVESPHFFVKRRDRVLIKNQQISYIQRHLSENTWCHFGLHVHNEATKIIECREWASISGNGSMRRDERILVWFSFLELWLVHDNRWQIAALCYDETERENEITVNQRNLE